MIVIPPSALVPLVPMPELAAGLVTVIALATTATLVALGVLIVGLLRERQVTRILLGHRNPATAPTARSAA
jgi:hypothetical protein